MSEAILFIACNTFKQQTLTALDTGPKHPGSSQLKRFVV